MKFFKKSHGTWAVSFSEIQKYIKKNPADEDILITKIKELILYKLVNNKALMKNLVIKSYEEFCFCYNFYFHLNDSSTLLEYSIDAKEVINYFEEHKNGIKNWQLKVCESLKNNIDKSNMYERFSKKKIADNVTYKDIFEILKLPENDLAIMIKENNFNGLTGEELLELIFQFIYDGFMINEELIKLFDFSDEEQELIYKNIGIIKYHYQPNKIGNEEFTESRNIVDEFTLNDELKNSILKDMPSDFNKLQMAYYIYRRLCQKFSYDEDFFCYKYVLNDNIHAKSPVIDHSDISRLNNIKVDSDVICTEITMIFAKFLDLLGIPYQIVDYDRNTNIDYKDSHMKIIFKIGDIVMEADAAHGLMGSDLSIEKSYGEVRNFKPLVDVPLRIKESVSNLLDLVDEYMNKEKNKNQFADALDIYESLYKKNESISIEERVKIITDVISKSDLKFIDMQRIINSLKKRIFASMQDGCFIEFVINHNPLKQDKTYELTIVIAYNENGDAKTSPDSNKYIVISSDKSMEYIDYGELKSRFENNTYSFAGRDRKNLYKSWSDDDGYKGQGHSGIKR